MKKKRYTILQFALGILFATLGLYIFFKDVSIPKLLHEFSLLKIPIILMCIILPIASLWFRALRLKLILPKSPNTHSKGIFDLVLIEFAVNNILPGRVGEAARAILLWKRNKFSLAVSIGSLLLERICDILIVLLFFIIPVIFLPSLGTRRIPLAIGKNHFSLGLDTAGFFLAGIIFVIVLLFVLYTLVPTLFKKLISSVASFFSPSIQATLLKQAREIQASLGWLKNKKKVVGIIGLSLFIELCYAASFFLLIGPQNITGMLGALFAQSFGSLGAAIPLAPGYIGTLHAMLLEAFTLLGHNSDKGRAVAIIYHAIGFLAVTPIGIYCMIRTHTPLKEIRQAAEDFEPLEKTLTQEPS